MERREFLAKLAELAKAGAGLSGVALTARMVPLMREAAPELMAVISLKDRLDPNLFSSIFNTKLVYPKIDHAQFDVFAIGDSNQYGSYQFASDPNRRPKAPIDYYCDLVNHAQKNNGRVLKPKMLAVPGKSTAEIMDQVRDQGLKQAEGPVSVFYHGGGDDFLGVVRQYSWEVLEKLSKNPRDLSAIPILQQADKTIEGVGRNVLTTFQTLDRSYGEKIRYIVLVGTANLSEVRQIEIDQGKRPINPNSDPLAKFLISQLSVRLHNTLVSAAESFQQRSRIPVLGVKTINFDQSNFEKDEHFNNRGKLAIAQQAYERVEFTGPAITRKNAW